MERILKIKGFEIKLEGLTEEENKKCDVVEEICIVDNRASRLIGWLFQKFGKDILSVDGSALDAFILSHGPDGGDYKILYDWIGHCNSKGEGSNNDKHIEVSQNDNELIKSIAATIRKTIATIQELQEDPNIIKFSSILKYSSTKQFIEDNGSIIILGKITINMKSIESDTIDISGLMSGHIYRLKNYSVLRIIFNMIMRMLDEDARYNELQRRSEYFYQQTQISEGLYGNPWGDGFHSIGLGFVPMNYPMVGNQQANNDVENELCNPHKKMYINHSPLGSFRTSFIPDCNECKFTNNCINKIIVMEEGKKLNYNSSDGRKAQIIKKNEDKLIEIDVLKEEKIIVNEIARDIYGKYNQSIKIEKEKFITFCAALSVDNLSAIGIDLDGDIIKLKDFEIILNEKVKMIIDDQKIIMTLEELKKIITKVVELKL